MSASESGQKIDVRAVFDTNIFVPAIAGLEPESRIYSGAIRTCWNLVVSEQIIEEYQRVMHEYGYPSFAIVHEIAKLCTMEKCRHSQANTALVGEDLAPRKDKHIVAPCLQKEANVIVTHDPGILQRKDVIAARTGAEVLSPQEATSRLTAGR